jgi:hypothetical protein
MARVGPQRHRKQTKETYQSDTLYGYEKFELFVEAKRKSASKGRVGNADLYRVVSR